MKVKIVFINDEKTKIERLEQKLNGIQSNIEFSTDDSIYDDTMCCLVNWDIFIKKYNSREKIIYIINNDFTDGWFCHSNKNVALISCAFFDVLFKMFNLSLDDYLIYQIAISLVTLCSAVSEMQLSSIHPGKSEGCFLDYCGNKIDVIYGIKAGHICHKCNDMLYNNVDKKEYLHSIRSLLNFVRDDFISKEKIDYLGVFVVMKFSKEKDKIYEAILEVTNDFGLNCNRADKNLISNNIYDNVVSNLNDNNYVIVDLCSNENVYLELGYALAKGRRIILIKKNGNETEPASDINNMIYIPYSNVNDLKKKLIEHLCGKFHLKYNKR